MGAWQSFSNVDSLLCPPCGRYQHNSIHTHSSWLASFPSPVHLCPVSAALGMGSHSSCWFGFGKSCSCQAAVPLSFPFFPHLPLFVLHSYPCLPLVLPLFFPLFPHGFVVACDHSPCCCVAIAACLCIMLSLSSSVLLLPACSLLCFPLGSFLPACSCPTLLLFYFPSPGCCLLACLCLLHSFPL